MLSKVEIALSRRNARRFLLAVLVSGFGSTAMVLVAGVWAKEPTGSDAAAGWMSVAMWAPVIAAPWLGGIADRIGHHRVLVAGNLLIGMALLSLALVEHGGGLPLLGAVMGLYGLSFVLLDAAEGALLPRRVSDAVLADINGRRMALQEGAKVVAPAVGAALFVVIGGGGVAILDAATFLVVVGLLARASGSVAVVAVGSACVGAGLPAVIATPITRAQRSGQPESTASRVGAVTTMLFVPHVLGLVTGRWSWNSSTTDSSSSPRRQGCWPSRARSAGRSPVDPWASGRTPRVGRRSCRASEGTRGRDA